MSAYYNKEEVDGILLLDKPTELSSNNVLQKVRRLFNAKKAGHTGALDPLATGMLPICFGMATKFSQFLLNADKRYHVIARLGQRTDTADIHGRIICQRPIKVTQSQLSDALNKFQGNLTQVPSMYSALKYHGKPLYKYARQGLIVERKSRIITIYDLKCNRWQGDELELTIHCSKGTYIRTIIDDLGQLLGCGAHVIYLRRLQVANYSHEQMITLEQLNSLKHLLGSSSSALREKLNSFLLPIDTVINYFPEVNISSIIARRFKYGQAIMINHGFCKGHKIRVTEGDAHKFIGIAEINTQKKIVPRCLVVER